MITIIYVNYFTQNLIIDSINSLILNCPLAISSEIIISNNGGDLEKLKCKFPFVIIIENNNNLGFGKANNIAVKESSRDFIFLLNPDTIIMDNCLDKFISFYRKNSNKLNIGVLGGEILDINGNHNFSSNYHANFFNDIKYILSSFIGYFISSTKKIKFNNFNYKKVDAVIGCNIFISKKIFNDIDGFDDRFFMYFEDLDLCRSVFSNFGLISYVIKDIKIIHLEGGASKSFMDKEVKKIKSTTYSMYIKSLFIYIRKHKTSNISYFFNRVYFKAIFLLNILFNGISFRKVFDLNVVEKKRLIKLIFNS
jgi:hypothetical protein